MHDKTIFIRKEKRILSQTEWGMNNNNELSSKLSDRYEFLNDPDLSHRLAKINKELQRTRFKLKRKKSDRFLLSCFLLCTSLVLTWLLINQEPAWQITSVLSAGIYLIFFWLLIQRILRPVGMDIRYLRTKARFLSDKKRETVTVLKQPE